MTQLELAQDLYNRGAFSQAADTLLKADEGTIQSADARLFLGVCLSRSHRKEEAVSIFEALLDEWPETFEALTWMAVLTKEQEGGSRAIGYAEKAIRHRPHDATGYSALGLCHQYHRRVDSALAALKKAAALAPNVAEHQHNLGLLYQIMQHHREARVCFQRAIDLAPKKPQSYVALADDYSTFGSPQGLAVLQQGLAQVPNSPALHSEMGKILSKLHREHDAELHFRHAMGLSAGSKGPYASWLLDQGRFEEAASLYEEMIRTRPVQGLAYYGLGLAGKVAGRDSPHFQQMQALRGHPAMGSFEQMHLRYALGRAEEQQRDFETAMSDFDVANRLAYGIHNEGAPPGIDRLARLHAEVKLCFERTRRLKVDGNPTTVPLFIVGMVRSGTTLLDQILSSHRSVGSAGEIRFWIQSLSTMVRQESDASGSALRGLADTYLSSLNWLAGTADRVIDKMPINFAYCGLIHSAMPNCRFIHVRRNPVDTCLSIYTTYFGTGTPFAYRKENIVAYYKEYQQMMDYWSDVLPPERLITVDYEDLVTDRDAAVRKLLDFCGLPWDDACLHHEHNVKAILTPSRWQARQPLYKSSIGRWRNFEPWLGEFATLLQS